MARLFTPGLDIALDVIVTVAYFLALSITCLRLWRRNKVGRLWWDDAFAFLALLGGIWLYILFWMKNVPQGSIMTDSHFLRIRFWMGALIAWITLWFTRISLALGTARIFPPQHRAHRVGLWAAGVFAVFLLTLLVMVGVECSGNSAWLTPPGVSREMCFIPQSAIWYSATVGYISDIYLVLVPVIALWNLKAPANFRLMLRATFTGSVVITFVTTLIVIFQNLPAALEPWRSETRVRLNYLESAVSIVVCNLIVVVPYVYRLLYGQSITGSHATAMTTTAKTTTKTTTTSGGLTTESALESKEGSGGISLRTLGTDGSRSFNTDASFTDISESTRDMLNSEGERTTGIWSLYDPESMELTSVSQNSRRGPT